MNIKFTLQYFADTKEWRLYREDGQYYAFMDLSRIHDAVKGLMGSWAEELRQMAEYK